MSIAGVDPGLSGAISIFDGDSKKLLEVFKMPTIAIKVAARKTKKAREPEPGPAKKAKSSSTRNKNILDELAIRNLLAKNNVTFVFMERAQTMRKGQGGKKGKDGAAQGVVSSGTTMLNYGLIRGICVGLGIPYHEVSPVSWKNAMLGKSYPKGDKKVSIPRAEHLTMVPMGGNHNKADSVLIGLYGINIMGGIIGGEHDADQAAKVA